MKVMFDGFWAVLQLLWSYEFLYGVGCFLAVILIFAFLMSIFLLVVVILYAYYEYIEDIRECMERAKFNYKHK